MGLSLYNIAHSIFLLYIVYMLGGVRVDSIFCKSLFFSITGNRILDRFAYRYNYAHLKIHTYIFIKYHA